MIEIGKIVAAWPRNEDGWSISPGVEWLGSGKIGALIFVKSDWAEIGDRVRIGDRAEIGDWARIGDGSTSAIDIGFTDGYRKCIAEVKGVAYIGAGCRWFTLDAALKHWGNHSEDRTMTMALLESAKAIAALKGWKLS